MTEPLAPTNGRAHGSAHETLRSRWDATASGDPDRFLAVGRTAMNRIIWDA